MLGVCAITACSAQEQTQTAPAGKINLRILYAGHPDSEREKDFVSFLREHFQAVRTGDLAKFADPGPQDADVIILDYDGDGFDAPRVGFAKGYARPTITVGVAGAHICRNLKTDYL